MAGQLRRNDIGSIIRVRVREEGLPFNAAAATTKTLKLQKPSGSVVARPAEFETNGTDGVFTYTTVKDDLNESGPWSGQIFMEFPTGQWHTDAFNFHVGENLELVVTVP